MLLTMSFVHHCELTSYVFFSFFLFHCIFIASTYTVNKVEYIALKTQDKQFDDRPGTTATVLSARNTRIVRSAAKLPSGNAIVIYLQYNDSATPRCSSQEMRLTHTVWTYITITSFNIILHAYIRYSFSLRYSWMMDVDHQTPVWIDMNNNVHYRVSQ